LLDLDLRYSAFLVVSGSVAVVPPGEWAEGQQRAPAAGEGARAHPYLRAGDVGGEAALLLGEAWPGVLVGGARGELLVVTRQARPFPLPTPPMLRLVPYPDPLHPVPFLQRPPLPCHLLRHHAPTPALPLFPY